jgi:Tol biopolymer transport system component
LIATTSFIRGYGYASQGQFSTQTLVTRAQGEEVGDLEKFTLMVKGEVVTAADKNLWGVTFADGDRFYATAASRGKTWLVEGSLSARRLTALREDAECPSLSPDGTRVVFKRQGTLPAGQWRLTVYDLRTGAESPLAEARSVDDQVEWLDDAHILYGLPREGAAAATSDIWAVPADGSGAPRVFVHDAWSPAVVQ